jgi:hypothetical protein
VYLSCAEMATPLKMASTSAMVATISMLLPFIVSTPQSVFVSWIPDDRAAVHRRISAVSEQGQRRFDAIIRNKQLHTGPSAFHAQAYADDDRRYAGGVQGDLREIGFDARRVGLDSFHG